MTIGNGRFRLTADVRIGSAESADEWRVAVRLAEFVTERNGVRAAVAPGVAQAAIRLERVIPPIRSGP